MKKEYWIFTVIGFLILGYVLDALVNPLPTNLPTPYHYFTAQNITLYPFTTTSIVLKALAVVIAPIIILSALGLRKTARAITMFILSALLQLYALQDVATHAQAIPLEWSIGFTLGGLVMFLPIILLFFAGLFEKSTPPAHDPVPHPTLNQVPDSSHQ